MPQRRASHAAVYFEHYILVFGGIGNNQKQLFRNRILMYNLYTEKWSRYMFWDWKTIPPFTGTTCTVAIGGDVYMFDGRDKYEGSSFTDALWKLNRNPKGCFQWSRIVAKDQTRVPSVRSEHTGWQYGGNLWIFAGYTESSDGYLNDNGDFDNGCSNHLFAFNPLSKEWRNPKCSGSVPEPRCGHASATIKDKVWVFGGSNRDLTFDDFYKLDMCSLVWTEIQTGEPKPQLGDFCTLNAVSDERLILHGGRTLPTQSNISESTWIVDLSTNTWKQYTAEIDHRRYAHTGTTGLNTDVIIMGGCTSFEDVSHTCDTVFHLMLEPRSLQQLAMQTIDKHQRVLHWKSLPSKLIARLDF